MPNSMESGVFADEHGRMVMRSQQQETQRRQLPEGFWGSIIAIGLLVMACVLTFVGVSARWDPWLGCAILGGELFIIGLALALAS